MIESFYGLLAALGFTHPIHPILVHAVMGLVIGGAFFSLAGLRWTDKNLDQSAGHCMTLALLFVVPVYIAGLLDWMKFFGGNFEALIVIKMILGVFLIAALSFAVWQKQQGASDKKLCLIYFVCLGICGGLGYSGGELVYGSW